jgi:putative proteasome-type protease
MTYCVGLRLNKGLVFMSDTRTNAGVDNVSVFRKMFSWQVPGERILMLMTAGNLATTQSVVSLLDERSKAPHDRNPSILETPSMFQAAREIGETLREVIHANAMSGQTADSSFNATLILGGQIRGSEPRMFMIYPEGNFIEANADTPFFQIGETKYGRPILVRAYDPEMSFEDAVKLVCLAVRLCRRQAHHGDEGNTAKHDDADIRHASETDRVEHVIELHPVFDHGDIRLAGQGIHARQDVVDVKLQVFEQRPLAIGAPPAAAHRAEDDLDAVTLGAVGRFYDTAVRMVEQLFELAHFSRAADESVEFRRLDAGRIGEALRLRLVVDETHQAARIVVIDEAEVPLIDAEHAGPAQAKPRLDHFGSASLASSRKRRISLSRRPVYLPIRRQAAISTRSSSGKLNSRYSMCLFVITR